jgi:hypothetical protein
MGKLDRKRGGSKNGGVVRDQTIMAAARRGVSFAEIGRSQGISRERVRQIVRGIEPGFTVPPRPSKPPRDPCQKVCALPGCDKLVCWPRSRFCDARHATGGKVWREVTVYKRRRIEANARWMLRHSRQPTKRRWARRVLRGEAGYEQWLVRGSRNYEVLRRSGLLKHLSADIKIKG